MVLESSTLDITGVLCYNEMPFLGEFTLSTHYSLANTNSLFYLSEGNQSTLNMIAAREYFYKLLK